MFWKVVRMMGVGVLVLIVCFALFVTFSFYKFGKQSQNMSPSLGLVEGRLKDCPGTPNCVLSYATDAPVSYTHLRAHETVLDLVCRLLLEQKKRK